ncbi:hypothetical protein GH810_04430 [Acetobacterium paludosum]|uniref:Uncharacterized protein n=1 Tax=Acetobacterium paludosum TaxID=52693 RepID=A0A923I1V3_9FIRM|nr:hypothetical protein [Acetobacterium paludosum]MBC3887550.1 hypothetical protein [Acetobacterium paludosum]
MIDLDLRKLTFSDDLYLSKTTGEVLKGDYQNGILEVMGDRGEISTFGSVYEVVQPKLDRLTWHAKYRPIKSEMDEVLGYEEIGKDS